MRTIKFEKLSGELSICLDKVEQKSSKLNDRLEKNNQKEQKRDTDKKLQCRL